MDNMTKIDKYIVIPAITLIVFVLFGLWMHARNNPTTQATATIDPELQRQADKELSPQVILRLATLDDKLKDRDKFMQESRTMNRQQLLERVEDLARLVGDCKAELEECKGN